MISKAFRTIRTGSLLAIFLCSGYSLFSQRVINIEFPTEGDISLTKDIAIPKVNPGYTIWLPEVANIKGMIVFTHPRRDTLNQDTLIQYALANHLAVLYATTDNRLEFFFEEDRLQEIEDYLQEAIRKYSIPKTNLLYAGMSLEGTRALKLAIFGRQETSPPPSHCDM